MGLFKRGKKRYNTVDKKITMFDRLCSESCSGGCRPCGKCGKRNAHNIENLNYI